jgi:LAS superfamily LD-carboxypeptidase LdcB
VSRLMLIFIALMSLRGSSLRADDCHETVIIDSVEYSVGERWCGKKLDSTALVDKDYLVRIPEEHCFEDYRIYVNVDARDAFVKMAAACQKTGISLIVDSGYRSARYQALIIKTRMAEGEKFADVVRYVAPPGYSLHETGRTVDFVPSDPSFARTAGYHWLLENAGQYGFVETSPKDTTGLMPWEPWHWTYIQQEL